MSKHTDYDAWYDEASEKTIPLRVMGKVSRIPSDAPAAALLRIQRLEQWVTSLSDTDDQTEPSAQIKADLEDLSYEGMVRSMVGDKIVDRWLADGIGLRKLQMLSGRLYMYYTGEIDEDHIIPAAPTETANNDTGSDSGKALAKKAKKEPKPQG